MISKTKSSPNPPSEEAYPTQRLEVMMIGIMVVAIICFMAYLEMMDEKETIESESGGNNISRDRVSNICIALAIIMIYLLSICLSVFFGIGQTDNDAGSSYFSSEDAEKKKEKPRKNKSPNPPSEEAYLTKRLEVVMMGTIVVVILCSMAYFPSASSTDDDRIKDEIKAYVEDKYGFKDEKSDPWLQGMVETFCSFKRDAWNTMVHIMFILKNVYLTMICYICNFLDYSLAVIDVSINHIEALEMMDVKETIESESGGNNISRDRVLYICIALAIIMTYLLSICLSVVFGIFVQTDKYAGSSYFSSEDAEKKKEKPRKNEIASKMKKSKKSDIKKSLR